MKKYLYGMIILFFLTVLTGCAALVPWTQLEKAEYRDSSRNFTATIPVGWMRNNASRDFMITKDGVILNQIAVSRMRINTDLQYTKRKFTAGMNPQELADVAMDDLKSCPQIKNIVILENKPATIAGMNVFDVHYTYMNEDGLTIEAILQGFIHKEMVYLLVYEAPAQHYFKQYQSDWEKFTASFKLND